MRYVIVPAVFVLCAMQALAQYGSVRGRITDGETGEPLIGANVIFVDLNKGAATNVDGRYEVVKIPPGIYEIVVSYIGYKKWNSGKIEIHADSVITMNVQLASESYSTSEVLIVAHSVAANQNRTGSGSTAGGASAFGTDEEYASFVENDFRNALLSPRSTFGIDVDVASYTNVRRVLNSGGMPPASAVRTEEMLNYFRYDYPKPAGEHPYTLTAELGRCPWQPSHRLLHIGLQGKELDMSALPPQNLVFLLDVSGSMSPDNKLPLLREAFLVFLRQLRPQDRVAIVTYAGEAQVLLPSTSCDSMHLIRDVISGLTAGGSTAGGAGILLAYATAKENFIEKGNNRIILATDGDFNVGVSGTDDLVALIEKQREGGVYLSILGFGYGNLKDEKLEKLADKGNGMYGYIDTFQEALRMFGSQLTGTLITIAKDVKIRVEFNPSLVREYRLIGYENRLLADADFRDDTKDAGEMGAGHSVTALYEIVPLDAPLDLRSTDPYKYTENRVRPEAMESGEMLTISTRYKHPESGVVREIECVISDEADRPPTPNFLHASAVAEFAMLLRNSPYKANASFDQVIDRASRAKGVDADGARAEFLRLVEMAKALHSAARP